MSLCISFKPSILPPNASRYNHKSLFWPVLYNDHLPHMPSPLVDYSFMAYYHKLFQVYHVKLQHNLLGFKTAGSFTQLLSAYMSISPRPQWNRWTSNCQENIGHVWKFEFERCLVCCNQVGRLIKPLVSWHRHTITMDSGRVNWSRLLSHHW